MAWAIAAIVLLFAASHATSAQTVYASNSEELVSLLKQNKDFGNIVLTRNFYAIDSLDVRAGGHIVPAPGKKPVFAGAGEYLKKQDGLVDGDGYWKIKLKKFARGDYFVMDAQCRPIPVSGVESGIRNVEYHERDIRKLNDKDRKIAIPIKEEYSYLRNKTKDFFKYCTLKFSCWFICMEVIDLYSDSNYIYGKVGADSHYVKIGQHEYMLMYATIFNYPVRDGSAFVDEKGFLHVPNKYSEVYISFTNMMFNLRGERKLDFNGITFTAAGIPIKMGNNSKNKSFYNCRFDNCGTGLDIKNYILGAEGNIVVSGCSFQNIYSNYAIYILTMKNVLVQNNTFSHTGILNKGGAVILINGPEFRIEGNVIEDFSYHGIHCGLDEKFNRNPISGVIRDNVVDNKARLGDASTQLYDGGGIYIYSHVDSVLVENNIVRNFGFDKGLRFGLYLDGGAYNVTARNNLVYNMYPGQAALHARYVVSSPAYRHRNVFTGNVIIGDCVLGGNKDGESRTLLENNYISGEVKLNNEFVDQKNNKIVKSRIAGEKVYVDRRSGLRRGNYSRMIRRVLKKGSVR